MSKTSRSLFLVCLFLALGGCAEGSPPTSRGPASAQVAGIGEGDIIETATGQVVPLDLLMERLRQQEVLYIGEEHHNRFHIEAALSLLRRFRSESRRPVVAMEMFGWDGQTFLDRYVGGVNSIGRRLSNRSTGDTTGADHSKIMSPLYPSPKRSTCLWPR